MRWRRELGAHRKSPQFSPQVPPAAPNGDGLVRNARRDSSDVILDPDYGCHVARASLLSDSVSISDFYYTLPRIHLFEMLYLISSRLFFFLFSRLDPESHRPARLECALSQNSCPMLPTVHLLMYTQTWRQLCILQSAICTEGHPNFPRLVANLSELDINHINLPITFIMSP